MALEGTKTIQRDAPRRVIIHSVRQGSNRIRNRAGIDYTLSAATAVLAIQGGKVEFTEAVYPYGKTVVIDHGARVRTAYAGLDEFAVGAGDCVAASSVLGQVGLNIPAGGITMLHFEVSHDGEFIYPVPLPARD